MVTVGVVVLLVFIFLMFALVFLLCQGVGRASKNNEEDLKEQGQFLHEYLEKKKKQKAR